MYVSYFELVIILNNAIKLWRLHSDFSLCETF